MRAIGIEKIDIYGGQLQLDIADLARARGADPTRTCRDLMVDKRAVYPSFEDGITLATNAVKRLLTPAEMKDIGLLVVGTESAVDASKSLSTWVHHYAGLPDNCRNFEIKHACYAGMAAMRTALYWLAAGERPGKKALVVVTDVSRRPPDHELGTDNVEYILGGGAVAMLLSDTPKVLSFDLPKTGYWSTHVNDFLRPTLDGEVIDSQLSLASYLDAVDGAFADYLAAAGSGPSYDERFKYNIYHAPFPGMTLKAHRTLLQGEGRRTEAEVLESFNQRVLPSLVFNQRVGSSYGCSIFISLAGLLSTRTLRQGDRISIFSYGSGCQSEFCEAMVGAEANAQLAQQNIEKQLTSRHTVTPAMYDRLDSKRVMVTGSADYAPLRDDPAAAEAMHHYEGKSLLVLDNISAYKRTYRWT